LFLRSSEWGSLEGYYLADEAARDGFALFWEAMV